jgi:hypothetical protein
MTFVFTNIGMAFSVMTNNYKYASGGIFSFLFFSNVLSIALSNLRDEAFYFSIWANLLRVFSAWNGISDNSFVVMDADISLSILGFISLICLLLVWFKIRRVELSE